MAATTVPAPTPTGLDLDALRLRLAAVEDGFAQVHAGEIREDRIDDVYAWLSRLEADLTDRYNSRRQAVVSR